MVTIPSSQGPALYILDFQNYTEELIGVISNHKWSEHDHILLYNWINPADVPLSLNPAKYTLAKDLMTLSEALEIDKTAADLSHSWHQEFNFKHRGIDVASLFDFPISIYFVHLIKDITIFSKMLNSFKPQMVYVLTDRRSFIDLKGLFGIEYQVVLTGNRLDFKEMMSYWSELINNRTFNALRKVRALDKLFGSARKAVLMDWWLISEAQEFVNNGYQTIWFNEQVLLQHINTYVRSFAVSKRRVYKLESKKIHVRREKALRKWQHIVRTICKGDKVKYKNFDLSSYLCTELLIYQRRFILPSIKLIDIWLKQLQGVKGIKSILICNDVLPRENALVNIAKRLNIHSTLMQHAVNQNDRFAADTVVFWGETKLKDHQRFENKDVDLKVIGNPHFDKYAGIELAKVEERREQLREKYGLTPADCVVMYATEWETEDKAISFFGVTKSRFYAFIDAILAKPYITVLLRFHPGETLHSALSYLYYAERLGIGHRIITDTELGLQDSLALSDVVVSNFSTVGLEAMLLNKPVVAINLSGCPDDLPYADYDAAVVVYSEAEIGPAIDAAIDYIDSNDLAEQQSRFIQDYAYRIDGKATQRLVEFVETLR